MESLQSESTKRRIERNKKIIIDYELLMIHKGNQKMAVYDYLAKTHNCSICTVISVLKNNKEK